MFAGSSICELGSLGSLLVHTGRSCVFNLNSKCVMEVLSIANNIIIVVVMVSVDFNDCGCICSSLPTPLFEWFLALQQMLASFSTPCIVTVAFCSHFCNTHAQAYLLAYIMIMFRFHPMYMCITIIIILLFSYYI